MADEIGSELPVRVPTNLRRIVDADDLRQSAMLRLYRRGAEFQRRTDAERQSYLRHSFKSALRDELRRENRACRSGERVTLVMEEIPADSSTPSRKAIRNEWQGRLVEALGTLPEDQRRAVTLHHLQGRTLTETADAMGKTFSSVAGLLRRALPTLRRGLEGYEEI